MLLRGVALGAELWLSMPGRESLFVVRRVCASRSSTTTHTTLPSSRSTLFRTPVLLRDAVLRREVWTTQNVESRLVCLECTVRLRLAPAIIYSDGNYAGLDWK